MIKSICKDIYYNPNHWEYDSFKKIFKNVKNGVMIYSPGDTLKCHFESYNLKLSLFEKYQIYSYYKKWVKKRIFFNNK